MTIKFYDPIVKEEREYFMEKDLQNHIDNTIKKNLQKKDKDCVLLIDGIEGSGKTTLALQIAKYYNPSLDLDHVCFTPEEFSESIINAKPKECIIYDEAFTGLSSRASLSQVNKMLVSLMMMMRAKNLFVIIVLPTIFLLEKYVALFRSNTLIHIYELKGRRGYFKVYNRRNKKRLYLSKDAKYYSYYVKGLDINLKGRFYGKFALGDEKEKEYRAKKEQAFKNFHQIGMKKKEGRLSIERKTLLINTHTLLNKIQKSKGKKPLTQKEFSTYLKKNWNMDYEQSLISHIKGELKEKGVNYEL